MIILKVTKWWLITFSFIVPSVYNCYINKDYVFALINKNIPIYFISKIIFFTLLNTYIKKNIILSTPLSPSNSFWDPETTFPSEFMTFCTIINEVPLSPTVVDHVRMGVVPLRYNKFTGSYILKKNDSPSITVNYQ